MDTEPSTVQVLNATKCFLNLYLNNHDLIIINVLSLV